MLSPQVVDGMDYLENVQSFHGELRAENIFLSRELTAKIANFGFYNAVNSKPCKLAIELKLLRFN